MLVQTFRVPLTIACLLMATVAPALGAPRQAHNDCNAENDPARNIAGCTRIVGDLSESVRTRSIAHVGRGLAYLAKGDRDSAITDFTGAIRLDPKNALAYNDRGLAWKEKGDNDRAIEDLTAAIKINPLPRSDLAGSGFVNLYANRGLAWQAKGDLDRAIADFDQAVSLAPRAMPTPSTGAASPGKPRARPIAPSPISPSPSRPTRVTRALTSIAASSARRRPCPISRWRTSATRSASTRA